MSKPEVQAILRNKSSLPQPHYALNRWQLAGVWYCYQIEFDVQSERVTYTGKSFPPHCMSDGPVRGLTVRWLWQKWCELKTTGKRQLPANTGAD
jgi:hypothetical protein